VIAGLLALGVGASRSAASSPRFSRHKSTTRAGDMKATGAFLTAGYVLLQAELAQAPAAEAAVAQLANTIGSECAGVLQGAPPEPPTGSSFARSVGERTRQEEQLSALESELAEALFLSYQQASRQAWLAYAAALRPLHWSKSLINAEVHEHVAELEAEMAAPVPNACADMKAWVASGYHTLAAGTKRLRTPQEKRERSGPTTPLESQLARYEGRAAKALIAKSRGLEKRLVHGLLALETITQQLDVTVGAARAEREPSFSYHPPGSVVIGTGTTTVGDRYEVLLLQPARSSGHPEEEGECAPSRPVKLDLIVSGGGAGTSGCYSPSNAGRQPSLTCVRGLWEIDLQTLATATSVRLALSNGRTVTSDVAVVPRELGGPIGLYYQVVRGPSPLPLSLTELNAERKTLRVVKLHPFKGCKSRG
jgi:hypothetical protein